jgi:hypothetical protein
MAKALSLTASGGWLGNDGSWSTYTSHRLREHSRLKLTKIDSWLKQAHQHKLSRSYLPSKLRMFGSQLPMNVSSGKAPRLPVVALAVQLLSNNVSVLDFRPTCHQHGMLSVFTNLV